MKLLAELLRDRKYEKHHCWAIVTDRIRRMREGNVFSLVTPVGGGGGYPGQVQMGGTPPRITPHQAWLGVPWLGGEYPTSGTPPVRPGWGAPWLGVPHLGYTPPVRPGWGVAQWGGTLPWVPPSDLAGGRGGGTPPQVTDGVLDTVRSLCLLRSIIIV